MSHSAWIEPFAKGEFTAEYAVNDGTNADVTATGKVSLVAKTDITPASVADFKVYVAAGSGIDASIKQSQLEYIDGKIDGELHYKSKHMANYSLTGRYTAGSAPDFAAKGTLETITPVEVAQFKGYALYIGAGAGVSGEVKAFALREFTAKIPLELHKPAGTKVVLATLEGKYTHADQKFTGTGKAEFFDTITVADFGVHDRSSFRPRRHDGCGAIRRHSCVLPGATSGWFRHRLCR